MKLKSPSEKQPRSQSVEPKRQSQKASIDDANLNRYNSFYAVEPVTGSQVSQIAIGSI